MPDDNILGSISIVIQGDSSRLQSDFAAAQAQAAAGGAKISAALLGGITPGIRGASIAFGTLGTSAQSAGTQAVAAIDPVVVAIGNLTTVIQQENAALSLNIQRHLATAESEEVAAVATTRLASAHGQAVSQIQAASGALRVLEGSGGIRAAERALTLIPGLGSALQLAFPLIGGLAIIEILSRVIGKFSDLTEEEKKLTEQTKQNTSEWERLSKELEHLDVERISLEFGKLAGLKLTSFYDESSAARDRRLLTDLQGQLEATRKKAQTDLATNALSSNPLIAGAQSINPTVTVDRYLAGVDWKEQDTKAKGLADTISVLTEKLRVYDAQSALNKDNQKRQKTEDDKKSLEDEIKRLQKLSLTAEEYRQSQESLEAVIERRNRAQSRLTGAPAGVGPQLFPPDAPKDLEILDDKLIRTAEEFQKKISEAVRESSRLNVQDVKEGGEKDIEALKTKQLQIAQQYDSQVIHTAAQQIAYQQQLNALADAETQSKIDTLEAVRQWQVLDGDLIEAGSTQIEIEREKIRLIQQQISEQTKLTAEINRQRLSRQLELEVYGAITKSAPASVGRALASGIFGGQHGQNVGRQVVDALKESGKSLLGEAFSSILTKMVEQAIIQTGLQGILVKIGLSKAAGGAAAAGSIPGSPSGPTVATASGSPDQILIHTIQQGLQTVDTDLRVIDDDVRKILAELQQCACGEGSGGGSSAGTTAAAAGAGAAAGAVLGSIFAGGGSSAPEARLAPVPAQRTPNASATTIQIDQAHFHGVQDVQGLMRAISTRAKNASPGHSPYSK